MDWSLQLRLCGNSLLHSKIVFEMWKVLLYLHWGLKNAIGSIVWLWKIYLLHTCVGLEISSLILISDSIILSVIGARNCRRHSCVFCCCSHFPVISPTSGHFLKFTILSSLSLDIVLPVYYLCQLLVPLAWMWALLPGIYLIFP